MLKKRKRSTHFEKMIAAILAFSSKDNLLQNLTIGQLWC